MPARTALLLGATGLVGGHCLELLLAEAAYTRVVTLGRRPAAQRAPRHVHHVVDFDRLDHHPALLQADDVFCCLGTTIRQAGSREAFRRVDHDYPLTAARVAHGQGARQLLLVTALGAGARSLFFYSRVKGDVEEAVRAIPYEGVYLFRPSLLAGDRPAPRPGERLAEKALDVFSFALRGPLRALRPTPARAVAAAMVAVAKARPGGVQVYEPEVIRALAAE